jgi:Fe-Mn family superoxide dismutase
MINDYKAEIKLMKPFLQRPMRFLVMGIALFMLLVACQAAPQAESSPIAQSPTPSAVTPTATTAASGLSAYPAKLPPLPYGYAALEPYIDVTTMKVHHDKHHATYVKNLNNALKEFPDLQKKSIEDLLTSLDSVPEKIRMKVRNNAGGHLNHTMFWQIMGPKGGGQPTGAIAAAINKTFGSFEAFKKEFNQAGTDRFGSGWVWLVRNPQGQLQITTTPNQDSPITESLYPILGNDVWEHAYYLKYQNRRPEYLSNWWNVINWTEVNRRFQRANS